MTRRADVAEPISVGTAIPIVELETEPVTELQLDGDEAPRRIGLFGGTFDPPHLGHLVLAMIAAESLALDRVLFIPASVPPNKQGLPVSSATDRLLMTRLAIAGDPCFELSPIEVERPGVSYTIETVEELRATYGDGAELFLVMAADSFAQIDTWREPDRLLSLIRWAVGPRPGFSVPDRVSLEARFGDSAERVEVIAGPSLAISSTEIRARVAAGQSIRYLVPRAVEEQIMDRGLYRR